MTAPCGPGAWANLSNNNNSVEGLLSSAHPDAVPPVKDLAFSGLYNSAVGAVVDGNTPVVNSSAGPPYDGTYGVYIRFVGTIELANEQLITITHDDGVSLWIDGIKVPGFYDGLTPARAESVIFTGLTGLHKIELIYANSQCPGMLSFSPKM
jgi:hypothetical protein